MRDWPSQEPVDSRKYQKRGATLPVVRPGAGDLDAARAVGLGSDSRRAVGREHPQTPPMVGLRGYPKRGQTPSIVVHSDSTRPLFGYSNDRTYSYKSHRAGETGGQTEKNKGFRKFS